jgi:Ca2+-binding EF-hand superfamily protein
MDTDRVNTIVNKVFDAVDTDKSGEIDYQEFKGVVISIAAKLGLHIPEEEIVKYMKKLDTDGSGKLSKDEFRALIVSVLNQIA